MSLKVLQASAHALRSMMSNPIAKTLGIGTVFAAGVFAGANWNNTDSFEKRDVKEVIENTEVKETKEIGNVNNTPKIETKDPSLMSYAEMQKLATALDNLEISNETTSTRGGELTHNHDWDLEPCNVKLEYFTTGTVNYNGEILTVKTRRPDYHSGGYIKDFYDSNGNLVYSIDFDRDSLEKNVASEVKINKYDDTNRLIESIGVDPWRKEFYEKYSYQDVSDGLLINITYTGSKGNSWISSHIKSKPNVVTTLEDHSIDGKGTSTYRITDKNGHEVGCGCYNPSNYENKNGRIIMDNLILNYNTDGLLISKTMEDSKSILEYDSRGNVIKITTTTPGYAYSPVVETFEYDNNNRLINAKVNSANCSD